MTAKILDGKALNKRIIADITKKTAKLKPKPCLAIIQVGSNPASTVYVNMKEKDASTCGFETKLFRCDPSINQKELLGLIEKLNKDKHINGFIIQKPLPKHIDDSIVDNTILPEKDVDGFHPLNAAAVFMNQLERHGFAPATPKGVIRLLEANNITLEGKLAVVIGRSLIVGRPLAMLFMHKNATVTICHTKTKNLAEITRQADIICSAIGKPKMIKASMVKKGAVVVDIGITRLNNGKLSGDVDFEAVKKKASWITPVPGGIGPMTRAMLLENTLEAYKLQKKGKKEIA